jgi:hypothetical protein
MGENWIGVMIAIIAIVIIADKLSCVKVEYRDDSAQKGPATIVTNHGAEQIVVLAKGQNVLVEPGGSASVYEPVQTDAVGRKFVSAMMRKPQDATWSRVTIYLQDD